MQGEISTPDGATLSFSVAGPEDAPWLALSNSLATDRRMWAPQIGALSADFRVLSYDTRGHGDSSAGDSPFSFDLLAGDVARLLDHVGAETADIVGLSLGGMTGLRFATLYGDRLRRLVCADARTDAPDNYGALWDGNIARMREGGMAALAEPTLSRWFSDAYLADPGNAEKLEAVREMILKTSPAGYAAAAACLKSLNLLPTLGDISHPVLYIVGEMDPAAPIEVMRDMADRTADARFAVIADAAHLSNVEKPDEFLGLIRSFLG